MRGALRCRLLALPALLGVVAHAQETSAPAAGKKPAPIFQASGIQGNTAPSGYASGASEAYSAKFATLATALQARDLERMVPAAERDGNSPQASALRALGSRNYAAASEAIDRLLATPAGAPDAHKLQGALDAAVGHPAEAIAEFDKAAQLDASVANLDSAGLARLAFGTAAEAQAAFASDTTLHPDSPELWLGLGLAAQLAGHPAEAREALFKAASSERLRRLAFTLLALENGTDAAWKARLRAALQPLLETDPPDAILEYDYALLLGNPGADDALRQEKENCLERAIRVQPEFAAAHFELGLLKADAGDATAAAAELIRANALDDRLPEWHYRLSRIDRKLNKTAEADQELHRFEALKAQQAATGASPLEGLPLAELIP